LQGPQSIESLGIHDFGEIVGVEEGIEAFGVVFGEHFYRCSEFLIEPGNKTIS